MIKKVGDYEIGPVLGEGAFGIVRQATLSTSKITYAMKIIDKEKIQREELIDTLRKEIQILMMIDHPNVVKLTEVLASRSKIYLVLEWIQGGELLDIVREQGFIEEQRMKIYFRQIVRALIYCQNKSIAHRDLKLENILVTKDDKIKISDFGLSSLYKDHHNYINTLYTTCGTINYLAPEVIQQTGYDGHIADIWSLGVILYFSCSGYLPFQNENMAYLLDNIVHAKYAEFPKSFSKNLKNLLTQILISNPQKRITLSKIMEHPWFLEFFNIFYQQILFLHQKRNINKDEIKEFQEDNEKYTSLQSTLNNNFKDQVNDQYFIKLNTNKWGLFELSEIVIVRKMGGIEFVSFLQSQIIKNIEKNQTSEQIDQRLQQFTSTKSYQEICTVLCKSFESLNPKLIQQINPLKTLLLKYIYNVQKDEIELFWEIFEICENLVLINLQIKFKQVVD